MKAIEESSGFFSGITSEDLFISVIIPSLNGEVDRLLDTLSRQTLPPNQVQVIKGVQPNGRARNWGVSRAIGAQPSQDGKEDILVFIDDDALPAQEHLIEKMASTLLSDRSIGVTGVARILPEDANWFMRRVAREIPRTVNQVPDVPIETNPNLDGYGHSLITTTCCALRKEVYEQAGGFNEELTSGVDSDFFYRVRQLGYRFVLTPDLYVEHPAPKNLNELVRKFYWYGLGYAQETMRRPEQRLGPRLTSPLRRAVFLAAATCWVIPNIFILYSYSYPKFALGIRPLKALSTYAVAWGYAKGWREGS